MTGGTILPGFRSDSSLGRLAAAGATVETFHLN